MSEVKPKFGKMKGVGYACILFSALLSAAMLFPNLKVGSDIGLPLVYFWTGTGVTTC